MIVVNMAYQPVSAAGTGPGGPGHVRWHCLSRLSPLRGCSRGHKEAWQGALLHGATARAHLYKAACCWGTTQGHRHCCISSRWAGGFEYCVTKMNPTFSSWSCMWAEQDTVLRHRQGEKARAGGEGGMRPNSRELKTGGKEGMGLRGEAEEGTEVGRAAVKVQRCLSNKNRERLLTSCVGV